MTIIVRNDISKFLSLFRILSVCIRFINLGITNTIGHPVSTGYNEQHIQHGHPIIAATLVGIAFLGIRRGNEIYITGIGEKRRNQIEENNREESGWGKETTVESTMQADEATKESHNQSQSDYESILTTQMSIHSEHEIAIG